MKEFSVECLDRPTDKLDPQQYILATIQGEKNKTPDEFMELMPKMSDVNSQYYGSCTSQACDAIKEFQEQKKLSQHFLYVMSKKISGLYNMQGEYIVSPLKVACKYGVPEEKFMPDNPMKNWNEYVRKEPSKEAYEDAKKYKGKTYWKVGSSIDGMKNAIYQNKTPVVFAIKWFRSYNRCPQSGILPAPDTLAGYHAVTGVAWDKDGLWVKNSFGSSWGNKGYFKILFNKWSVVQPYAAYVLLDLPNNNKTMKLFIDGNNNQVIGDKTLQFGFSIPNPEKLEEIKEHCKKTGNKLKEPEKNDMVGWYLVRGTNALGWKNFLNL